MARERLASHNLDSLRVRSWLLQTQHRSGKQIPSPLTIGATLGLSGTEVSRILASLEAEGLIGRTDKGDYVLTDDVSPGDALLAGANRILVSSIIERSGHLDSGYARRIVDCEVARLAAIHCTDRDVEDLRRMCSEIRKVRTWHEYSMHDTMFHNTLGEICGNVLLAEMAALGIGVQFAHMWRERVPDSLGPNPDFPTHAEHLAVVEAMARRDDKAAADAMRTHLRMRDCQVRANGPSAVDPRSDLSSLNIKNGSPARYLPIIGITQPFSRFCTIDA